MSHNPERYQKAEALDITSSLMEIRKHIGELEDLRQPTRNEVEAAAETLFPQLLTNERSKIVDAFMKSEADAAVEADAGQI
jgi:hypothetical protein